MYYYYYYLIQYIYNKFGDLILYLLSIHQQALNMFMNLKQYYRQPLYRNSIALMLNQVFGALFGLFFWIVAARTMPSKDIGLATAVISAATLIIGLSRLGLDAGLMRYLPESKNKNEMYSTVSVITLILALTFTIIFIIGIEFFSPALLFLRDGWFLLVFFAYIAVSSIYTTQNMVLIVLRRADLSFFQNLFLGLRIPILFYIVSLSVIGIFSAFGIAFLFTLICGMFMLYSYGIFLTHHIDIGVLQKILKFSLGNYSAGILAMAPITIIPLMILNMLGPEDNAYFYVAYSIAGPLSMIPNAVSTSLFVEGSHNLPLRENVIKSMKLIVLFLIPSLIILFLFGNKLLMLYNKEYSNQSLEILWLLASSSLFSAVILIYVSIKKIQKDLRTINYMNLILSMLLIGAGYFAILNYGLIGLGYAWFGANLAVCFLVLGKVIWEEKWFNDN